MDVAKSHDPQASLTGDRLSERDVVDEQKPRAAGSGVGPVVDAQDHVFDRRDVYPAELNSLSGIFHCCHWGTVTA